MRNPKGPPTGPADVPGTEAAATSAADGFIEAVVRLIMLTKRGALAGGHGLSRAQVAIIFALAKRSPRRITELAEPLCIDLSVLSRQVAALVESGLVDRHRDPEDGRAWLLSITNQGQATMRQIREDRRERFTRVVKSFPDHDIQAATAIVRALSQDLELTNHPRT